jgi:YjjG family noncanonical pyrimidine nucleotidase
MMPGMGRTYTAFLLDADNTVFDYDRCEADALEEALAAADGAQRGPAALRVYRRINAELWGLFERGQVSLADLKIDRFRALAAELELHADPEGLSRDYLRRLAEKTHLMPHAREVLESLASVSLLGLVTNGVSEVQRGRIARAGIRGLFRSVVISEELGVSKPDPRFFRRALTDLGVEPREALCVGDSLTSDIRGARLAGVDSCWFNPHELPLPEGEEAPVHVVKDLRDLLPLAGL